MQKRIRIWLGIGSAALVGGLGSAAVAGAHGKLEPAAADHGAHLVLAQGGEGGEGGGEQGDEAVAVDPDRALATNLLLMKGHLRVGDALVRMDRWSEALPHFLHPIEELYGEVRDQLDRRDLPPFGDALELLGRTVRRQGELAAYEQRLKEVSARIDAALQGVFEGRTDDASGGLVAAVAADLVGTAAEEYGAAFEDDRLVNVAEYQDSFGFVQEAKALLEAHQARFAGADAERLAEIRRNLTAMEAAWPGVVPPQAPAMTPGEVLALASSIELAASGVR